MILASLFVPMQTQEFPSSTVKVMLSVSGVRLSGILVIKFLMQ